MIHILRDKATKQQLAEMLEMLEVYVKLLVAYDELANGARKVPS